MQFKLTGLKGYVEFKDGEIIPHGDPDTKYMKALLKRAENWKEVWEKADDPDFNLLSDEAKRIVESVEAHGYAVRNFNQRVKKQIESGLDKERTIELWENWLPVKNREAAIYFYERQMYEILKNV